MNKLFVIVLIFISIVAFTQSYQVTYKITPPPTIGATETSNTIDLYYFVIDLALATPTKVGTLIVHITKQPKIEVSLVTIEYLFDKEYFDFFKDALGLTSSISATYEGEVAKPKFALKSRRYTICDRFMVGLVVKPHAYWISDKTDCFKLTHHFDITKSFTINAKLKLELSHENTDTIIIPETKINIHYEP